MQSFSVLVFVYARQMQGNVSSQFCVCSIKGHQAILLPCCGPGTDLPTSLQLSFARQSSHCVWLLEHDFRSFSLRISVFPLPSAEERKSKPETVYHFESSLFWCLIRQRWALDPGGLQQLLVAPKSALLRC